MKISAENNSPNYFPELVSHVDVFVDREKKDYVISADEEEGWVTCYLPYGNGEISPNSRISFKGKVEIKLKNDQKQINELERELEKIKKARLLMISLRNKEKHIKRESNKNCPFCKKKVWFEGRPYEEDCRDSRFFYDIPCNCHGLEVAGETTAEAVETWENSFKS